MLTVEIETTRGFKGGLGSAMAGGNPKNGRVRDDWYPTPPDVTKALLQVEEFPGRIWEPCAGDGAIVNVLRECGYKDVVASDFNPRAPGILKRDLFSVTRPVSHSILTNPPFKIDATRDAADIIKHLLSLRPRKLALMLKASYWHAMTRTPLFENNRPAWIYPLNWRPDFHGLGRPVMEVAWVVWHAGNIEYPRYKVLSKPLPPPPETHMTPAKMLAIA